MRVTHTLTRTLNIDQAGRQNNHVFIVCACYQCFACQMAKLSQHKYLPNPCVCVRIVVIFSVFCFYAWKPKLKVPDATFVWIHIINGFIINFVNIQLAHVIREIRHFQQTPYKIEHIPKVTSYLLDSSLLLDDDELYSRSLQIEPRTSRLSAPNTLLVWWDESTLV